jgi:hypothetical protein
MTFYTPFCNSSGGVLAVGRRVSAGAIEQVFDYGVGSGRAYD